MNNTSQNSREGLFEPADCFPFRFFQARLHASLDQFRSKEMDQGTSRALFLCSFRTKGFSGCRNQTTSNAITAAENETVVRTAVIKTTSRPMKRP